MSNGLRTISSECSSYSRASRRKSYLLTADSINDAVAPEQMDKDPPEILTYLAPPVLVIGRRESSISGDRWRLFAHLHVTPVPYRSSINVIRQVFYDLFDFLLIFSVLRNPVHGDVCRPDFWLSQHIFRQLSPFRVIFHSRSPLEMCQEPTLVFFQRARAPTGNQTRYRKSEGVVN